MVISKIPTFDEVQNWTSNNFTDFDSQDAVNEINSLISEASDDVSGLDNVVSGNVSDISQLQSDVADRLLESDYTPVDDVEALISIAANSIEGLDQAVDDKLESTNYKPVTDLQEEARVLPTYDTETEAEDDNLPTGSLAYVDGELYKVS